MVWQLPLGTGYGSPTVSAGRLFQFDRMDDQAPATCAESTNGPAAVDVRLSDGLSRSLRLRQRAALLAGGRWRSRLHFGAEGMLHCLAADSGKLVWKIDTAAQFGVVQNFFGVGSTPIVEQDLLIVQIGGSPAESQRAPPGRLDQVVGNGTGIVAFDKKTGTVHYKITDELASYSSPVLATIGNRRWCFVFARGGLVGFEPASGKVDFHFPWRAHDSRKREREPASCRRRPGVHLGDVWAGRRTGGVKPGEASVVWSDEKRRRDKAMQTHWNTSIHHEGYLYGSSGRHTEGAELRCIELATGKVHMEPARSDAIFAALMSTGTSSV